MEKSNRYAGTQTEKNLEAAFAGESQARNKYTYFASKAPEVCPVCAHPQSYFEVHAENY